MDMSQSIKNKIWIRRLIHPYNEYCTQNYVKLLEMLQNLTKTNKIWGNKIWGNKNTLFTS